MLEQCKIQGNKIFLLNRRRIFLARYQLQVTIGSEINKKTYMRTSTSNATIIDGVLHLTSKNCRDSGVGRQGSGKLYRSS